MNGNLSVCIIMKNEQKVIERCLDSIFNIADEIIVVDTGSDDQSKEIALKYTDKVFDFEWVNDFSKARNYASSKAKGKWIFVLDADEFVEKESFKSFNKNLEENPPEFNIGAVQIVSFTGQQGQSTALNYHERLYLNNSHIFFHRSIHELLQHNQEEKERRGFIDFQIYHSGYLNEAISEKEKSARNLPLLLDIEKKEAIDYFFIGNEYKNINELEKSISYYRKAYNMKPDINLDWVKKLLLNLSETLHSSNRDKEALEILGACEEIYPDLVDFIYLKGVIFFKNNQFEKSKKIFENILLQTKNLTSHTSIDFLELLPRIALGEIYFKENNLQKAVQSYSKALSINATDDEIWGKLIKILASNSTLEELTGFLNNNMLNKSSMTTIRAIKVLLSVLDPNVQKLSRSFLSDESISPLEKEALLLKNFQLDGSEEEIINTLKSKNENEVVAILSTSLFNIVDYVLLTIETDSIKNEDILYNIKYDQPLENLYNMIFKKKNRKLTLVEENFFVKIYNQSQVLNNQKTLAILYGKRMLLSKKTREKIKK